MDVDGGERQGCSTEQNHREEPSSSSAPRVLRADEVSMPIEEEEEEERSPFDATIGKLAAIGEAEKEGGGGGGHWRRRPEQRAKAGRTAGQLRVSGRVHPQPPVSAAHGGAALADPLRRSRSDGDKRFDSFKTWSGRLERQISNFRRKPPGEDEPRGGDSLGGADDDVVAPPPPVQRYLDALAGPELDVLKPSEESMLPDDQLWPFLLRFPISSFSVCLGVGGQALLWKALAAASWARTLHVGPTVNLVLWCAAAALTAVVASTYTLKIIFYFEAVRREYYHPVRVNFFFAPWMACVILAKGAPPSVAGDLPGALWYALMAPILCLDLKIYGQWMLGGERRLSRVANPSGLLSVVANLFGAALGASMGIREGATFFFAVGMVHYLVLFVTLYQRLPTNETVPRELHPVFFLFVTPPSAASLAWAGIAGDFDYASRIAYFVSLFLLASLVVRINFFRGFRFSLSWWAYGTPMAGAAITAISYSTKMKTHHSRALAAALAAASTFTVFALVVTTVIHAFVQRDLFPNDASIAVTERRSKPSKKRRMRLLAGGQDAVAIDIRG